MRTIVLVLSLVAVAASSQAAYAQRAGDNSASQEQRCREMVGKETTEGEGRSHISHLQAQRFSLCMMGRQ